MSNDDDTKDVKLARPVAIVDLWDIDDQIVRLEDCTERLERVIQTMLEHAHDERVRDFERILREALNEKTKGSP